jgi:hypothetical protein
MTDDPNKKHVDGWFVSDQEHELDYFKATMKKAFPGKSDDEIAQAILFCRESVTPSEGRAKLTECISRRLRG